MKRKITVVALCAMLFALCVAAHAQQAKKVPRIGFVGPDTADARTKAFQQGLRDLGYIEEKNILVEYRYAGGKVDRYRDIVAELVQLNVDVLVAVPFQAILAAKQATKTIPVVIVTTLDPVATGRKYHGACQAHPSIGCKTVGVDQGVRSDGIARRSPPGCG